MTEDVYSMDNAGVTQRVGQINNNRPVRVMDAARVREVPNGGAGLVLTGSILIASVLILTVVSGLLGITIYNRIATNLCIMLVLVAGLQVFMGNSGILSFAHCGFMGIGAYTAALLSIPAQMKGMALPDLYPILRHVELHPYIAILIGGLMAALLAASIAYPLMRLSDSAAVITSFGLLVMLYTIMNNWSALTNGPRTLFGLPKVTDLSIAAGAAIIALVAALVFKETRTGKLLRASRDDEIAATAMGANIPVLRWRAFVLAAFFAGIGGGLWGHFITSFSPKAFYLKEMFLIITMLVIGGANTVTGAVVGTFVITFAYEGLRALESGLNEAKIMGGQVIGLTEITLAIAMIVILVVRPGGLFPTREIGTLIIRALITRRRSS